VPANANDNGEMYAAIMYAAQSFGFSVLPEYLPAHQPGAFPPRREAKETDLGAHKQK
jgi:hypothetical protein